MATHCSDTLASKSGSFEGKILHEMYTFRSISNQSYILIILLYVQFICRQDFQI